jgi:hypothetical protein
MVDAIRVEGECSGEWVMNRTLSRGEGGQTNGASGAPTLGPGGRTERKAGGEESERSR